MTAMIYEIFVVGREGYRKSKMIINVGAMFITFVLSLEITLQGNLQIYSI